MPTYEYRCEKCAHFFEEYQSITADPLEKCPACGRLALRRLIGPGGGLIFKGSGFYLTDYRSDSYRQAAEAESKAVTGSKPDKDKAAGETPASTPAPAAEPRESSPKAPVRTAAGKALSDKSGTTRETSKGAVSRPAAAGTGRRAKPGKSGGQSARSRATTPRARKRR